jgi:His-Xaa-Ser system protein HxsD
MTSKDKIEIHFSRSTQLLGPLQEAAYRLLGVASCRIEATETEYVCVLRPKDSRDNENKDRLDLELAFLDAVTDENLREKVGAETKQVRDLLLALAFGAWSRPIIPEKSSDTL